MNPPESPCDRNDDWMAQRYFGPGGIVLIQQIGAALPDIYRLLQDMDRIHVLIERLESLANFAAGNIPTVINGNDGLSAYRLAVDGGYVGSVAQWIASLHGLSAYQLAQTNGFTGSLAQWLTGLEGTNGLNADYAIAGNAISGIAANEILTDHVVVRACTIPGNFVGSRVSVGSNPTANFILTIFKNGVAFGSLLITPTGVIIMGTTGGTPVALVIGDVITVVAPATTSASIARLRYTLKGI